MKYAKRKKTAGRSISKKKLERGDRGNTLFHGHDDTRNNIMSVVCTDTFVRTISPGKRIKKKKPHPRNLIKYSCTREYFPGPEIIPARKYPGRIVFPEPSRSDLSGVPSANVPPSAFDRNRVYNYFFFE